MSQIIEVGCSGGCSGGCRHRLVGWCLDDDSTETQTLRPWKKTISHRQRIYRILTVMDLTTTPYFHILATGASSAANPPLSLLATFPDELILYILKFLDVPELYALTKVSTIR